jgi:uncharacterized membrane protein YjjB (DUF3815 family)
VNPATSLWAAVAALGFATVFAAPKRALPGILVLAGLAHLLRAALLQQGASLPLSSAAAALLVGLCAAFLAPRTMLATPILAFAPVIPLLPGKYMFQALTGVLELAKDPVDPLPLIESTATDATIAMMTVVALALGTIGPTLILLRPRLRPE